MGFQQAIRDNLLYYWGYARGTLPSGPWELYGSTMSKLSSLVSLPLPLLSFLVLPLYGGSSTTINLAVFYLTWSALVFSKGELTIELYGTLAIRLFCFILPALGCLAFDWLFPKLSRRMKARGIEHLPIRLGRDKLLTIAGVSVGNVLLSVLLQAVLEVLFTRILRMRSLIKVSAAVPLPWTILTDMLKGLVTRGVVQYLVHRYALHTYDSILKDWHLSWQHSLDFPFSLVAAYDHPVNYLLAQWMPTILPAVLFRWHVLEWHLFIALASLEELFVYSGYAVLPSSIMLAGMARRTEAHFDSVKAGDKVGNFGRLGLLDFLVGTTCDDEDDVMDDIGEEADKHQLQDKVQGAVGSAMSGVENKRKARRRK